jgi:hypothetical protein
VILYRHHRHGQEHDKTRRAFALTNSDSLRAAAPGQANADRLQHPEGVHPAFSVRSIETEEAGATAADVRVDFEEEKEKEEGEEEKKRKHEAAERKEAGAASQGIQGRGISQERDEDDIP